MCDLLVTLRKINLFGLQQNPLPPIPNSKNRIGGGANEPPPFVVLQMGEEGGGGVRGNNSREKKKYKLESSRQISLAKIFFTTEIR